jgi:hypothetical protein
MMGTPANGGRSMTLAAGIGIGNGIGNGGMIGRSGRPQTHGCVVEKIKHLNPKERIRLEQSQLQKLKEDCNHVAAEDRRLRQQVDAMRKERATFEKLYNKLVLRARHSVGHRPEG